MNERFISNVLIGRPPESHLAFLRLVRFICTRKATIWLLVIALSIASASAANYWVEFGVYDHPHYALILKKRLNEAGLHVVVVRTHTPQGQRLIRVRTTVVHDKRLAEVAEDIAVARGRVQPLLHRGSPTHSKRRDKELAQQTPSEGTGGLY